MMNSADTQIDVNADVTNGESNEHFGSSICDNGSMENHGYVRKRTRATAEQLAVLEDTFTVNVSPNSKLRKQLSEQLKMSERSIQIWFQNRRAKVKHVQKRVQMQMQQAAIRAQLYHYHQQQYGQSPFGAPPMIPMQPNLFQQPQVQVPPQQPYFYPAQYIHRVPLPRAQSVGAVTYYNPPSDIMARSGYPPTGPEPFVPNSMNMPPVSNPSSWSVPPTGLENGWDNSYNATLSRQSVPPYSKNPLSHSLVDNASSDFSNSNSAKQVLSEDLNNFVHGQTSPSPSPTENENSGFNYYTTSPTIGLAEGGSEEKFILTEPPLSHGTDSPEQELWTSSLYTNATENSTINEEGPSTASTSPKDSALTTTINPSSIMMTGADDTNSCNFNISALTVGTWHRVKLHSSDLICCYEKNVKRLVWYIAEGSCRFKIEIHLASVSSIEYVSLSATESLAEVHVYMTQPPLFYMESASNENDTQWMQCSDFTENKQASRYMRHVLKGASKTLKQDLIALVTQQEEMKSLVKFNEDTATPLLPSQQQKQVYMPPPSSANCHSSSFYSWPAPNNISPNYTPEQFVACGFYS
ncbi:hypothetical protein K501DRAFT_261485 [Backusella circina FSU 941]|nr:hypothetical protein K501DRAFT_261485 [Backusella circina FSU 941]